MNRYMKASNGVLSSKNQVRTMEAIGLGSTKAESSLMIASKNKRDMMLGADVSKTSTRRRSLIYPKEKTMMSMSTTDNNKSPYLQAQSMTNLKTSCKSSIQMNFTLRCLVSKVISTL